VEDNNLCEVPGLVVSGEGEVTCIWIYSENSGNTGSCREKNDTTLECGDVKNSVQCEEGLAGTFLAEKCIYDGGECKFYCKELKTNFSCNTREDCSWIYNSEESGDNDDEDGICYEKKVTDISCEDISRISQCESGGDLDELNDQCDVYVYDNDTLCKKKCSLLKTSTECMSSERQNDCYFLEDFNGIPSSCIDQVCLL
jgi:hypothetical protein